MRDRIMGMNDGGAGRDEPEELPFFFCFFFLVNISVSETRDNGLFAVTWAAHSVHQISNPRNRIFFLLRNKSRNLDVLSIFLGNLYAFSPRTGVVPGLFLPLEHIKETQGYNPQNNPLVYRCLFRTLHESYGGVLEEEKIS